jgi:hypothetical protein
VDGPGFINIKLKNEVIAQNADEMAKDERLGCGLTENPHKVVLDYGGPNVAKTMHVGHLRSGVIGESVSRIERFVGNEVISDRDHGGSTLFSLIADGSTPRFTTDSDSKKTREIDSYKSYWNKHKAYVLLVDDEYMRYVEFCDENTVKPMEFRSWFESNYSEGDIRLYDGTDDPANDVSKPKSATREYWQQYNAKRRERQRLYQQQRKGTR